MSEVAATPSSTPTTTSTPTPSTTQSGLSPVQNTDPKPQPSASGVGKLPTEKSSPSEPEYFEVKVNGKVMKMTRDEVVGHASMSHAAQSKFEEAAKINQRIEKIINSAKNNPIEALMDPALGLSKDQIRDAFESWYTREYIEPETLSPQELEFRKTKAELEKYREQDKLTKDQAMNAEREKVTKQYRDHAQQQIIDAMEKSGMTPNAFYMNRMAFYMRENLVKGWDAPTEVIVNQVKQEVKGIISGITKGSSIPEMISILGDEFINKIRKYDLEQLREKRSKVSNNNDRIASAPTEGNRSRTSMDEVRLKLNDIRRNGF